MARARSDRQILNTMDRLMAALERRFRSRHLPGLMLQSHLWLRGRIDVSRMNEALDRIVVRFPVLSSRRVERRFGRAPYWKFVPPTTGQLRISELPDDGEGTAWKALEDLLNTPIRVEIESPIRFHLMRRPGAGDLFVAQWSHSLMDGLAGGLLLAAIDEAFGDRSPGNDRVIEREDEMVRIVNTTPMRPRLRSLPAMLANTRHHHAVQFAQERPRERPTERPRQYESRVRVGYRSLSPEDSRAVHERVRQLCGFADPTPVLIACALRAAARCLACPPSPHTTMYVKVPINLRSPGAVAPICRNMQSYVRFAVPTEGLSDLESLIKGLRGQLRDQLLRGADLGYLFGGTFLCHSRRAAGAYITWACAHLLFLFGYHGRIDDRLPTFCGLDIERAFGGIPTAWAPPGVLVTSGLSRESLFVVVSYVDNCRLSQQVEEFLSAYVDELLAVARSSGSGPRA